MIDSSATQEQQPTRPNFQERPVVENVTERLLRPIEINQELEGKYRLLESGLRISEMTINGHREGVNKWFTTHLNSFFKNEPQFQAIAEEDVRSLKLITEDPALQRFREIYGYNYRRPAFFLSLTEFRTICNKLRGGAGSDGMVIAGGNLENDPITKGLNIIIAGSGITNTIKHETKHTLDPQLTQRRRHGRDEVLEEFASYWGDVIIPRVFTSTSRSYVGGKPKDETKVSESEITLGYIKSNIESDIYLDQYKNIFPNRNDYASTVSEIAGYIKRLQGRHDKFQIDRMLMNAVKIEDLKKCVEEQGL